MSVPKVHVAGDPRLDAVLDLVGFAARPCPLTTSLDEIPRRLQTVFAADICSVYLLEGDSLVMRGNVGFPHGALGEVRLEVGEGITGSAVRTMRPMSLEVAATHVSYRHFPALGEEQFPVFLAVPVAGPDGPLGAVVLQRRQTPGFTQADVELLCALTAPIAAAAERARLSEALRGQGQPQRSPGGGTRRVTLSGRPAHDGRSVGATHLFRRPAARTAHPVRRTLREAQDSLAQAMTRARKVLDEVERFAAGRDDVDVAFLQPVRTMLLDGRLPERILERVEQGEGLAQALAGVGSEAARSGVLAREAYALGRAQDMTDLCEALSLLLGGERRAGGPRGAVLVGERITLFDLLVSSPFSPSYPQPVAVVLAEHDQSPLCRAYLQLLDVPTVVDVRRLFDWVADGDVAMVDGDHGLVRLNPARAEVATLRLQKKLEREGSEEEETEGEAAAMERSLDDADDGL